MKKTFLSLTLLLGLSTLQANDIASLSIQVQPSDARVRIMNIVPKFHNGIELDKGKSYHLLINKKGYRTVNRWIKLDGDKTLKFNLVDIPKSSLSEIFSPYSSRAKSYNYRQDVKSSSYMVDKSLIRKFGIALNLGDLKTVKKMIKAGVDVNIRFSSGMTPLHIAVARGRLDMVKYLVAQGADTSAMDKDYAVPAFVAVRTNPQIAEY